MEPHKLIHTLILDAGPLIKNDPAVSSLIASAQVIVTHSSVIAEIRDEATRSRLETTLRPFITLRDPKPESVRFIQDFAKKSGDLQSLSRPDILLIALTYEIECEKNGGDWRLRRVPGQKGLNGSPPKKESQQNPAEETGKVIEAEGKEADPADTLNVEQEQGEDIDDHTTTGQLEDTNSLETTKQDEDVGETVSDLQQHAARKIVWGKEQPEVQVTSKYLPIDVETVQDSLNDTHISQSFGFTSDPSPAEPTSTSPVLEEDDNFSDSDTWITPSNLSKHQARGASSPVSTTASKSQILQAALLTTDYAMQNVALLLNLNLLSSSLARITTLRTTAQRCHACFFLIRPSAASIIKPKQFCPRCGLPTLTRVSCSISASTGAFSIHLKKNMQWSNRGSRYSVPKPTAGSSSGIRVSGGGKGGWGNELLLAEDQKEYVRAVKDEERRNRRERDLMDDEFLGGLLGGGKGGGGRAGGRVKVGAGRDINAKKRR